MASPVFPNQKFCFLWTKKNYFPIRLLKSLAFSIWHNSIWLVFISFVLFLPFSILISICGVRTKFRMKSRSFLLLILLGIYVDQTVSNSEKSSNNEANKFAYQCSNWINSNLWLNFFLLSEMCLFHGNIAGIFRCNTW